MKLSHKLLLLLSGSVSVAALSGAATLASGEAQALAIDFTDSTWQSATGRYGSIYVKDTTTPANDRDASAVPYDSLTYTSPSAKMTMGPAGTLRFGAHNLLLQSEALDSGSWLGTGASVIVTGNNTNAPDGTLTAEKITFAAATTATGVYQNFTYVSGATYAFSVYLKSGTYNYVTLDFKNAANSGATFDLSDGTIGFTDSGITSTILSVGDGWYKCTIEWTANATSSFPEFYGSSSRTSNGRVWTPSGGETYYAWGAHLRRTPSDDKYLATTSAARYDLPYEWDSSGNLLGILVEEARTNTLQRSQELNNAYWTADGVTVAANDAVAPDGTTTAEKLTESSGGTFHRVYELGAPNAAATHTISIFGKAGTRSWVQLYFIGGSGTAVYGNFNLSTGATGSTNGTVSVQTYPNGWYRCILTGATNASAGNAQLFMIDADTASAAPTYSGNGSGTIYLWGAQLEVGSFPTSYIPTLASTVTRAADNISLATSAFPWSATANTMFVKLLNPAGANSTGDSVLVHGGSNSHIFGLTQSGNIYGLVRTAASDQANFSANGVATSATAASNLRLAAAANDAAWSANGGAVATDATVTMPTVTTLSLHKSTPNYTGADQNYIIQKLLIVPRRVSDGDLPTFGA